MNDKPTTAEIAEALKVSERHARRLKAARDWRVQNLQARRAGHDAQPAMPDYGAFAGTVQRLMSSACECYALAMPSLDRLNGSGEHVALVERLVAAHRAAQAAVAEANLSALLLRRAMGVDRPDEKIRGPLCPSCGSPLAEDANPEPQDAPEGRGVLC